MRGGRSRAISGRKLEVPDVVLYKSLKGARSLSWFSTSRPTKFQRMREISSLIKAEDSAGEGRRRKSWWAQPDRKEPVEAEPGNA
jgi:hypothetical protein